jgi:serine/threonine protein kinase
MAEREFHGTDRFEIRRRLGQGGMGVVYEAHDRLRASSVALKTLTRFDAQAIYRMKQEFRALTDVSHPNLAQLYELVSANGHWFFTMELVDGVDFLNYVRGGGFAPIGEVIAADVPVPRSSIDDETWVRNPFQTDVTERVTWGAPGADRFSTTATINSIETARIPIDGKELQARGRRTSVPRALGPMGIERTREAARQLVEGMLALHDAGMLHRDIKPSNVMVTKQGRVVLLDFGLVTEMYERWLIQSTMEGMLCGTVAYMAPEQSVGAPLGPTSDWYSVGVMLFESLTGCLPFEGKLFEIILDKQERDAPLASELVSGVPDDLDRLCRDLLRRNPDDRPSGREVLKRLGGGTPESGTPVVTWKAPSSVSHLIGRRRELGMLRRAFETVQRGATVVVHLHGRSGIGKSSLVRDFLDDLAESESATVLSGRCYEREIVPYKALDNVIDALSHHLRKMPKKEARALLQSVDMPALLRVFPVLKRVDAIRQVATKSDVIADPQQMRTRAVGALRDLIHELAKKNTVVMAIDDLHWGDEDSALLLGELLRPPHSPEILLLAVYRSEDRDSSPVVRALRVDPDSSVRGLDVRELPLGPLDPHDAEELARFILAQVDDESTDSKVAVYRQGGTDPEIKANAIARESRGNPFLVHELASYAYAELRQAVPSEESGEVDIKLERAIQARLRELSKSARRLIEVIAVASSPIQESLAFRAAGIGPGDRTPIAVLTSGRYLRAIHSQTREPFLETYHQGITEAVKGLLSPDELRAHHRAIAEALETEAMPDPESLVHHLRAAGERRRAAEHALKAAEHAREVLAFDRAASLYRLAIDLLPETSKPESELYATLGDALVNAGRAKEAAEAFVVASKGATETAALDLLRRAAEQLLKSGHVDRGAALMREVLECAGVPYPETSQGALRKVVLERVKLIVRGLPIAPLEKSTSTRPPAETANPEDVRLVDVLWSAALGLAMVDFTRGAYFHTQHLKLAVKLNDPYRLVRALAVEAALLAGWDKSVDRTNRVLSHLRMLAKEVDVPHARGLGAMADAFVSLFHGDFKRAASEAERAIAVLSHECSGVGWELDTSRIILYGALVYLGRLRGLSDRVRSDVRQASLRSNLYGMIVIQASPTINTMWLALDRVDFARSELEASLAQWPKMGPDLLLQQFQAILAEAQFDLYQGEATRAYASLRDAWPKLESSLVIRLGLMAVEAHYTRARAALAAARTVTQGREKMLRIAKADAKRILRTGRSWAKPFALFIEAALAFEDGDRQKTMSKLREAEAGMEAHDLSLHRAVCMRTRGALLGGVEGASLVEAADAWMRANAVVDPERFARALSPLDPRS